MRGTPAVLAALGLATLPPACCGFDFPDAWLEGYDRGALAFSLGGAGSDAAGPPVGNVGPGITDLALPSVGNGYVSTQVGARVEYVAGLFNGHSCPGRAGEPETFCPHTPEVTPAPGESTPHRAILPSSVAVDVVGAEQQAMALSYENGTVTQLLRHQRDPLAIQQLTFAHRTRKHVMVLEVRLDNRGGAGDARVELDDAFTDYSTDVCPAMPGPFYPCNSTSDVVFTSAPPPTTAPNATLTLGQVRIPDLQPGVLAGRTHIATCRDIVPRTVSVPAGEATVLRVISARVAGSASAAAGLGAQACAELASARADAATGTLLSTHVSAWQALNAASGVRVESNPALARIINGTMYAILAGLRGDEYYSISPGALSTNGYNGHVFWGEERPLVHDPSCWAALSHRRRCVQMPTLSSSRCSTSSTRTSRLRTWRSARTESPAPRRKPRSKAIRACCTRGRPGRKGFPARMGGSSSRSTTWRAMLRWRFGTGGGRPRTGSFSRTAPGQSSAASRTSGCRESTAPEMGTSS